MTIIETIKAKFAHVGVITDVGASAFALDNSIDINAEVTAETEQKIAEAVDAFVNKYLMRPSSVSEAGFSQSWSVEQIRNHALIMMKKYAITPNKEVSSSLQLRVLRNVSDLW